jgi:hypothetical protein
MASIAHALKAVEFDSDGSAETIYKEYWFTTLIRGFVALLAGSVILIVPELATTVLVAPFTIVASIVCLGAYGIFDSAMVLATSFMVSRASPGRLALRFQGVIGAIIGALLFALVYSEIDLHWFLYLAAVQAAGASIAELTVGRSIPIVHGVFRRYASAGVAACSAVLLLFGMHLSLRGVLWLLFGYLGVFGFTLVQLSAKMLFADRQVEQSQLRLP